MGGNEIVYPVAIKQRTGTTAQWEYYNPTLRIGEIGVEILTDGQRFIKLGNGSLNWRDLEYYSGGSHNNNNLYYTKTEINQDFIVINQARRRLY
jgi:hypothetical protein